jgi:PIN domain nuclease of toxin-antitoxin system
VTRYLLDTRAFLWLAADDPQLSPRVRALFVDAVDACCLSVASVWEMAIKASLGKLALGTTIERLVKGGVDRGIQLLSVESAHAYQVEQLPFHHRDPFDRMLVAQALHEDLPVVSRDAALDRYPITRLW